MLDKLFPRQIDNSIRGYKAALWIFGTVIALRMLQSVMIIFNGYQTVKDADGIPIDTYPGDAAQNIMALFALNSLWRLLVCLLGILVLVRYRSAVPIMFVLLLLNYFGSLLLGQFMPLVRVGTPPGPIVNMVIFGLMAVGLTLSLLPRHARE